MRWFFGFILIFFTLTGRGQVQVEGFVRDELGQAIPFAHIALKHHELEGVVSQVNGFFSVEIELNDTLVFSHVGFKPLEVPADSVFNDRYINVTLPADFVQLDPVYVLANNKYKVPKRYAGQPYEVSGVEKRSTKKPVKAGSLRGGDGIPDPNTPIPGPSLVLHGPLSFFTEKEQRQAAGVNEETYANYTYRHCVNSDEVRDSLMLRYDLAEEDLSNLLVIYNQQFPQVHTFTDVREIWNSLTDFFDRQKKTMN